MRKVLEHLDFQPVLFFLFFGVGLILFFFIKYCRQSTYLIFRYQDVWGVLISSSLFLHKDNLERFAGHLLWNCLAFVFPCLDILCFWLRWNKISLLKIFFLLWIKQPSVLFPEMALLLLGGFSKYIFNMKYKRLTGTDASQQEALSLSGSSCTVVSSQDSP